jgi:transcriptional regulator with XRE-family HTH domain
MPENSSYGFYCSVINIPQLMTKGYPVLSNRIGGEELKQIRVVKGMTQQQFAVWAGLSISAIAKCEQGYTRLNVGNTDRIRRAMMASMPISWHNRLDETIAP